MNNHQRKFNMTIGNLDRSLSEIMIQAKIEQDIENLATLRHHAGDLILFGIAILKRQEKLNDLKELLTKALKE